MRHAFQTSLTKYADLTIHFYTFIPLVAKLRSTSLQIIVTKSEGLKIIVSVMSSLLGGVDIEPSSSFRLCTASTANSHYETKMSRKTETEVAVVKLHKLKQSQTT